MSSHIIGNSENHMISFAIMSSKYNSRLWSPSCGIMSISRTWTWINSGGHWILHKICINRKHIDSGVILEENNGTRWFSLVPKKRLMFFLKLCKTYCILDLIYLNGVLIWSLLHVKCIGRVWNPCSLAFNLWSKGGRRWQIDLPMFTSIWNVLLWVDDTTSNISIHKMQCMNSNTWSVVTYGYHSSSTSCLWPLFIILLVAYDHQSSFYHHKKNITNIMATSTISGKEVWPDSAFMPKLGT